MSIFTPNSKDEARRLVAEALAIADQSIQNGKVASAEPMRQVIHKLGEAIQLLAA